MLKIIFIVGIIQLTNCNNVVLNYYFGNYLQHGEQATDGLDEAPSGYIRYKNSFYKYHPNTVNFANAVLLCEGENAHLAILNSQEEATFLANMIKKDEAESGKKIDWAYVGFHDYFKEGQYTTILGQSLYKTGYVNWLSGQPDNYNGNENCGTMTRDGLLNDLNCGGQVPFICEIEISQNC